MGDGNTAKAIGVVLTAAICAALFFLLPLPHVDLSGIPVPDLPGWVRPVLKWGKFAVIAVLVLLAVIAELEKRR